MLKKLKENSRFFGTILAVIIVGGSLASAGISIFSYYSSVDREYVMKIGSEKVYSKSFNMLNEIEKISFVDALITRAVINKFKNRFHLSVSNSEVNDDYVGKIKNAREKINRRISEKELVKLVFKTTPAKLREGIYNEILSEKIKDIVSNSYVPSEKEIKSEMKDGNSRDEAIENLRTKNSSQYYQYWLENERENIAIEYKDVDYEKYGDSSLFTLGSLSVKNHHFARLYRMYLLYPILLQGFNDGDTNEEKAARMAYSSKRRDLLLASEALSRGFRCSKKLSSLDKINYLKDRLEERVKEEILINENTLKSHFMQNRAKYDEKERAYVDVLFLPFKASSLDIIENDNRAKEALDRAIKSNELPNINKKRESKEIFSKRFGRKYFRDGEVVPSVINDGNIRVIAKEQNGEIEYVEFRPSVSENSLNNIREQASKTYDQIFDEKIDLKKAIEIYSDINFKKELTIYRDGKFDRELEDAVMKSDKLVKLENINGIYIFKRRGYYPEKRAKFEDVRERVISEVKSKEIESEIEKLLKRLEDKKSIKITPGYFKDLIDSKSEE